MPSLPSIIGNGTVQKLSDKPIRACWIQFIIGGQDTAVLGGEELLTDYTNQGLPIPAGGSMFYPPKGSTESYVLSGEYVYAPVGCIVYVCFSQ